MSLVSPYDTTLREAAKKCRHAYAGFTVLGFFNKTVTLGKKDHLKVVGYPP
jgi:hypothetical protein